MKKSIALFWVVLSVLIGTAESEEVVQIFRPEVVRRSNVGLEVSQGIDRAAWIWLDGVLPPSGAHTPFVRFTRTFDAIPGQDLIFDVSADSRFVLMLDGHVIARGPHKGMPGHWYYESYAIRGLSDGEHRIDAVVFDLGGNGPHSIVSTGRNGFALNAEGSYDPLLTTGKAPWLAAEVKTIRCGRVTDPETMTGTETISHGTGFLDARPPTKAWRLASIIRKPLVTHEYGYRQTGWTLFPTERPDPISVVRTGGVVRAVQPFFDSEKTFAESDTHDPRVVAFNLLKDVGAPVTVPPGTQFRFVWDFGDYYCGYPLLATSGGKGAKIRWSWTESLYDTHGHRGDRSALLGKRRLRSMDDMFFCDGRVDAKFSTPWWRAGRWAEISIETADEPLVLTRLALEETRYPMTPLARFRCDDPSLADVQAICVRGLQNCLHETFMDCPYFEQLMYPGDTRVEMLTMSAISDDDRLIRAGMGLFDFSRRDDGTVPMSLPQRAAQDSSTYSFCWVMMAGDYVRWHGTNDWIRARVPGVRHTMSSLAGYENADGLVENLPGWSFVDWVPEWGTFGNAPDGRRGLSSVNNLQYVQALHSASVLEAACGDAAMADYWRRKAARTGMAIVKKFWSDERGMLADTLRKDCFSEHAQCLALLTDILSERQRAQAFKGLTEASDLARTTVYFSHYLFETYLKFGRSDLFLRRLDLWRDYVKNGLKTPVEAPGARARSDCHAWGAHPLYHLLTGVAGIRPAADGYTSVIVAPQPGPLGFIQATAPTPKGLIYIDLHFSNEHPVGTVVLPPGLTGEFVWQERKTMLKSGMNEFVDEALRAKCVPRAAVPRSSQGLVHDWDPAPNWWAARHESKIAEAASYGGHIDIVLLGDSITHNWEGARGIGSAIGGRQLARLREQYSVLCLGYGGDDTRNVLWRVENGELDGYVAKCVMLLVGTNNGADSAVDTAAGVKAILKAIEERQPKAKVVLVSVFPRGEKPTDPSRVRVAALNTQLRKLADGERVIWCDFGKRLLEPDGTISKSMMFDFLHPTARGYDIWLEEVWPFLRKIIGEGSVVK